MTYLLLALPFTPHNAPEIFRVKFETTAGCFLIEAHRDWSPHGADRFYELVRTKYYDDSRFFRVVPGRWVQFGINGNPSIAQQQRRITIPDDPLKQHNTPGFVAFSNTGPNTRSTQVYINLGDNTARNDIEAGFAPFGQVDSKLARKYDGTGLVDCAFFDDSHAACAHTVFHSWLLLVRGVVQRRGPQSLSVVGAAGTSSARTA